MRIQIAGYEAAAVREQHDRKPLVRAHIGRPIDAHRDVPGRSTGGHIDREHLADRVGHAGRRNHCAIGRSHVLGERGCVVVDPMGRGGGRFDDSMRRQDAEKRMADEFPRKHACTPNLAV
ncbi:hypothetical protein [Burkholderia ubonensis]|uniref:hypothetical protein n=1 Tax=Burkholderia ubonensis TaxID=101571 RepID=UPI00210CDDFE|nr:hypothetical protein [Burkholderia ubonensis]